MNNGIFTFISATIFSLMEIEIEGKNGWCKNLPTTKNFISSFTLYHVFMNIFIMLMNYKLYSNLYDAVFYTNAWFLIEDFMWFVLNPYFTIKKYKKEFIPWHKRWLFKLPIENYICGYIMCAMYKYSPNHIDLYNSFFTITGLIYTTTSLSPYYHRFYIRNH